MNVIDTALLAVVRGETERCAARLEELAAAHDDYARRASWADVRSEFEWSASTLRSAALDLLRGPGEVVR